MLMLCKVRFSQRCGGVLPYTYKWNMECDHDINNKSKKERDGADCNGKCRADSPVKKARKSRAHGPTEITCKSHYTGDKPIFGVLFIQIIEPCPERNASEFFARSCEESDHDKPNAGTESE